MAAAASLTPVDRLDVLILVDNATDGLSTTPANVETEFSSVTRRGLRASSGRCLCCAVHGLSCLITAERGGTRHAVLFDSGPEDYAFERNTTRLGADLGSVESIVLSHGHWDHSGAMFLALHAIRARNGGRPVPYYAHPGMFHARAIRLPNGNVRLMDDVPGVDDLTAHGARVVCTTEPQLFLDDMFYVSGEIPRHTAYERGVPNQVRRTADGKDWEPDELVTDERWLAVNLAGRGLVVFSACSHAGIVNVLSHARATYPDVPIHAVVGGLHLSGPQEQAIPQTVEAMKAFSPAMIAAGHCTGWRAMSALAGAFGDKVLAPLAVGKRYTLAG
ncbi:MAG TPA: MBL fold metallo-hydrolase [Xanthobacteraceae bacterium]|jgi:7,8-dihydropterin-6-yl-methyl-4-(beta-D-ribofuranosyl)aminobenzene 5'-phosphate synthase